MSISVYNNTITFDGVVTVTNATDPTTGVCTLQLTPRGGIGTLPFMSQGEPGPPPVLDSVTVNQIAYNATRSAPVLTPVSSGGPGVASHYTLAFDVNGGAPGTSGSFALSSATDLEGTVTDQYTVKYVTADGKWKIVSQLCGDNFNVRTFTSAAGNSSQVTLASTTIAAQPFNWRPIVSGLAYPSGTANTHIDLVCRLSDPVTGDQVGYGGGVTGAGSGSIPVYPVNLFSAFGSVISTSTSYGMVMAGQAAQLFFVAKQTVNTTTDAWTCPSAGAYFQVKVDPIPGTN